MQFDEEKLRRLMSEFKKTTAPRARKSRLEAVKPYVMELREDGFTHAQIADFLTSNGLPISGEAVRKFLNSRGRLLDPARAVVDRPASTAPHDQVSGAGLNPVSGREKPAEPKREIASRVLPTPTEIRQMRNRADRSFNEYLRSDLEQDK